MYIRISFDALVRKVGSYGLTTVIGAVAMAAPKPVDNPSKVTTAFHQDSSHVVVDIQGTPPPAPLFFSTTVDQVVKVGQTEITGEAQVKFQIQQGRPEVLTLGLTGEGEVTEVIGKGLREWSVRQAPGVVGLDVNPRAGKRFLDLLPILPSSGPDPVEFEFTIRTKLARPTIPGRSALLLLIPGETAGFTSKVLLQSDGSVDLRVTAASGVVPLNQLGGLLDQVRFFTTGPAVIEIELAQRGAGAREIELMGAQLSGKANEGAKSVDLRLRGQLRARKNGTRLRLLGGGAALSEGTSGDGWHVEIVPEASGQFVYELVADREGVMPIDLSFVASVHEVDGWQSLDFSMPAGEVVPLQLEGWGKDVHFAKSAPIVPVATSQGWLGYLPADGAVRLQWRHRGEVEEGALFFTSFEKNDVRVGAGLLRQSAQVTFQILQGKLTSLRCQIDGPGEILSVTGTNLVGWKVISIGERRVLDVQLSRPIEGEGALEVVSQTELGAFPLRAEPLRLTPEGGVRHAGFIRVANAGAVRLEVTDAVGMMQLAPEQYPSEAAEAEVRQIFVYRFPSADYRYRVGVSQIQPEIAVSEIVTYQLAETDRVMSASLELDVREALLRDWTLEVPADYTVVAVNGADISDYAVETDAVGGYRRLKIVFGRAVEGRQLIALRLEKNQPAGAGEWSLAPLRFPDAKSVRGHVGVVTAPGFRIVPANTERLVELPLNFFPQQTAGLQQAWRVREAGWVASVQVEALGQSVQADVFHLYSIKEGIVYGSVLLNYFVVGAPATEWRIAVPEGWGNIDVVGQNVRRDWRRDGDQIIVSLHQPVLGAATLLITFEQPMSARGGSIRPGDVRPLGVQSERGFIQVVSPLQVKHELRHVDGGLLKMDPLELPAEFRLLTSLPSLAVYHYTARPFDFEMGIEWYGQAETIDQVIDFAKLSSQVSRDGEVVTVAQYFVKTRGRKALRLMLPEGVKLWEVRVDNEAVTAQVDGEQTLIPLPARLHPNDPAAVTLRLGQLGSGSGRSLNLLAPRTLVPAVINEWTIHGDTERKLVPRGGNAELLRPALTETGFEWISFRGRLAAISVLAAMALGLLFLQSGVGLGRFAGFVFCAIGALGAVFFGAEAAIHRRPHLGELTYAATMVPAGEAVSIRLANLPEWRPMLVHWGLASALVGLTLMTLSVLRLRRATAAAARAGGEAIPVGIDRILPVGGGVLLSIGVLAQPGGASLFFAALAVLMSLVLISRVVIALRAPRSVLAPGLGTVGSLVTIASLGGWVGGGAPTLRAESPIVVPPRLQPAEKGAQAIVQSWSIRGDRLFAEVDLTLRGGPGESFLFLRPPALLTDFKSDGLRVGKVDREGQTFYYVAPEREGVVTAHARYEMPISDLSTGLALPTGSAAKQRVTIDFDQGGWEFASELAVRVIPTSYQTENRSAATLVFLPGGTPIITVRPKQRNAATEATQFFIEASQLYVPGPGVLNGYARVMVRPVQGRVAELDLEVPNGLTVGDVAHEGEISRWRFDPQKHRLHLTLEPAQSEVFTFGVETQLGTGALPFDLSLEPLRVIGAAGDMGMMAIAVGGDVQPEAVRTIDLSPVNPQDFDANLLPHNPEGQPLATLQHVWRYGQSAGRVNLKISAVLPEIRVSGRQVLSIDDDRMVMAVDLNVGITRVGLFKLSFVIPEGLEVEALSGPALSHWTETPEESRRVVTLHLKGRTMGEQTFTLTLAGAAPHAQTAWTVPRLLIREATRQTGEALIVPGKGLRLRAVEREGVTQLDPRSVGAMQPGTLAFRLLQEDWALHVGIEALEPWVTVQSLQEMTMREGQTLTRIGLRYRVENAAVKHTRIRLPGLSDDRARTVRASGPAVSDMVKLPVEPDLWELRFQRSIVGETEVQIEFQGPAARVPDSEKVATPVFVDARQVAQFVAIRGTGRLELEGGETPRGWTRIDWTAVPPQLQDRTDRSVPALCFRVAEPEGPLVVAVRRHEIAEGLKLRVTQGALTTLFSPAGSFLTAVELKMDVLEKGTLRVRLPEQARLFNTFVNGESVTTVREGDAYLFLVAPSAEGSRSALVRLVYAASGVGKGSIALTGPSLSVPLENVTWRVVLPPGYDLDDYRGGLRLQKQSAVGSFGLEDYRTLVVSKRSGEAQKAAALLQEATSMLQRGDQQKASEVLSRISNNQALDAPSNEDARVQLRNLKTQQAVLGLNTRRQRLYLDNRVDATRNEQLEQAADLNPFMKGKVNFDPQQIDQLLMGNTADENTALKSIASRLVDQQLVADPAPGAIDVTLPEKGHVLTFTRSLQVEGSAPLELALTIQKISSTSLGFSAVFILSLGALVSLSLKRRTT